MTQRASGRREQIELAATLRGQGQPWRSIADELRERHGINARVAMRLAHGWGQGDVAGRWNDRWPDDPKTFKNISYWENWPSATGYAPSLTVLERLAALYECSVADLIHDWGDHSDRDEHARDPHPSAPDTMAWRVENYELPELTRAIEAWSDRLPVAERRWLLLKLSTAAAAAHRSDAGRTHSPRTVTEEVDRLAGRWHSRYRFRSSSRDAEFDGVHTVEFRADHGRLVGRSAADDHGSVLTMELTVEGLSVIGSWAERTSPAGHYRAATYRGSVEFVLDPTGRSMRGKWLGLGKHFIVNSGEWELAWIGPLEAATDLP